MDIDWQNPSYYPLAVFLCIVGSALGFFMAYAFAWLLRGRTTDEGRNRYTFASEQAQYMRRVRLRNMRVIALAAGGRYSADEDDGAEMRDGARRMFGYRSTVGETGLLTGLTD